VIAFNTFRGLNHFSHQGTHTYRLFKLLKNFFPTAPNLPVRQQQRGKIMKQLT
jgi:hypothetical protein